MSIHVQCPACRRRFSAPDRAAGRTRNCPACEHPIEIPNPQNSHSPSRVRTPPPTAVQSDAQVLPRSVMRLACPTCGTTISIAPAASGSDRGCPGCGVPLAAGQVACRRCELAARQVRWEQKEARSRAPEPALLLLEPDELVVCVARGRSHIYVATDRRLLIAPKPRRLPLRGSGTCQIIDYHTIIGSEEFSDLSDRARIVLQTTDAEHVLEFDEFEEFHRLSVQWPSALALYATGRHGPEYTLISLPC